MVPVGRRTRGTYLEIGAFMPEQDSNTWLLDNVYGWRGLSVEWMPEWVTLFNVSRANPCILGDATRLDYGTILKAHNFGTYIDYLQIDVDPPESSLIALMQVLRAGVSFGVITFEHDFYAGGEIQRLMARQALRAAGYHLVVGDVEWERGPFEDWWINPAGLINMDAALRFEKDAHPRMDRAGLTPGNVALFKEALCR